MPFDLKIIPSITTVFGLLAYWAWLACRIHVKGLEERRRVIEDAPDADKGEVIKQVIVDYAIPDPPKGLTQSQTGKIVLEWLNARSERDKQRATTARLVAVLITVVLVVEIVWGQRATPSPQSRQTPVRAASILISARNEKQESAGTASGQPRQLSVRLGEKVTLFATWQYEDRPKWMGEEARYVMPTWRLDENDYAPAWIPVDMPSTKWKYQPGSSDRYPDYSSWMTETGIGGHTLRLRLRMDQCSPVESDPLTLMVVSEKH